jgi:nicotinamide-nucleotide amidase
MFPEDIDRLARLALDLARGHGVTLATVESCTGGLVAGALTAVPGSSDVVDRGFVTYSNAAKSALVGVPEALIAAHGAVSRPVAVAMAEGGLKAAGVGAAVSVTGVAGPGGGSPDKPVGLVHFALARAGRPTVHREERFGDLGREAVRLESVRVALEMLVDGLA